jgi:hypothetical protein
VRLTIRWSRLEIQPGLPRVDIVSEMKASCSAQNRWAALQIVFDLEAHDDES